MKNFLRASLVAAASAVCFSASADVVIDDFSIASEMAGGLAFSVGTNGQKAGTSTAGPVANILGGERDIWAYKDSGAGQVSVAVQGNQFSFAEGNFARGSGHIRWDGVNDWQQATNTSGLCAGGAGVGCADLSSGGGFKFTVASDGGDEGNPAQTALGNVFITIWSGDGLTSNTLQFEAINTGGPQEFVIYFADPDWSIGGFDWSSVGAIEVDINTNFAALKLDIELQTVTVPMPEPASLGLAGLALFGLGVAKRRKAAR